MWITVFSQRSYNNSAEKGQCFEQMEKERKGGMKEGRKGGREGKGGTHT